MDSDGVVIGIEHDDLEQAAGRIGADHQDPVAALPYDAERDRDRCQDLRVGDFVPPSALRNLHHDRLPCQAPTWAPCVSGSRSSSGRWRRRGGTPLINTSIELVTTRTVRQDSLRRLGRQRAMATTTATTTMNALPR